MRARLLGEEHPDVVQSIHDLAFLYYAQGRYSEAEPLCKEALAIAERVLGVDHPTTSTIGENYQKLQNRL